MLWTLYRAANSGTASVSTFRTRARPAISRARASTSGAAARQGPHQEAQKSTRTGTRDSRMMPSKVDKSALMGAATGASAALQDPHRPVSARWLNVTRFFVLQTGQVRMIDWLIPH